MDLDITDLGSEANELRTAYENKQLAHSYLFIATNEKKALNTAYWLACLYNCLGTQKPDKSCLNCQQILSGNHPDVLLVQPEGKKSLGIDQVRPLKEELAKSPVQSDLRFFIIYHAERLTLPASNALLNLLEEPIAPVVTILIADNADQVLPTVKSRTQMVSFKEDKSDSGRRAMLMANGFSLEEIAELSQTHNLDQQIKYFYQECLAQDSLALVSAHQLADSARSVVLQNYVLFSLKKFTKQDLAAQPKNSVRILKKLLEVDQMQASNVSFRSLLDYLALF